jgi:hypothetical protein
MMDVKRAHSFLRGVKLSGQLSADEWAQQYADDNDQNKELDRFDALIDKARAVLFNYFLDRRKWASVQWKDKDVALEALWLCVEYNRAKVLHYLRIAEDSPRGIAWVSHSDIERFRVHWYDASQYTFTIPTQYLEFAYYYKATDEFILKLNLILTAKYPCWYEILHLL